MLMRYKEKEPRLGAGCYVADSAAVIGDVTLEEDGSVWFGASVRGDVEPIVIGPRTNVQDNATIHCSRGFPVTIGADVSIGHNAVVHGAVLEDEVLVGMGAVVLDGAVLGAGSIVAAGAVVTGGTVVPPRSLVMGVPARVVRSLAPGANRENAQEYVRRKAYYQEAAE